MRVLILSIFAALTIGLTTQSDSDNDMVLIPSGEFMMGNDMKNGLGFSPAHNVKVNSFYMDKYEVTNREYFNFVRRQVMHYRNSGILTSLKAEKNTWIIRLSE